MEPRQDCCWANKMVLNPAMVKDPEKDNILHMLFRSTGPFPQKQIHGKPLPYPIFIGYAISYDKGKSWQADFSRPALAPALKYLKEEIAVTDIYGREIANYANGGIEDPRLFNFEGQLYLSVACRAFPSGPYWDRDDPVQCMPDWALNKSHNYGRAVSENYTVTLLFKVDLVRLKTMDYEHAFSLVGPLHDPDISDDRDVFLFPRRLTINGKDKIICIHRPKHPWNYPEGKMLSAPSIFIAMADSLAELAGKNVFRQVLAASVYPWEANRIGGSWAPLEISPGEWLLPYHGKQDDTVGYTQSFMILKETCTGFPVITHRPSERLMYASEPWELEGDFSIPCMFTCSGVIMDGERLLMGYGAADMRIGIAETRLSDVIAYVRRFDADGVKHL